MKIFLGVLLVCVIVYLPWFSIDKTLSSGDWPYLYKENIEAFSILKPPFLWVDPYYQLTAKIGIIVFSLSWEVTEKIFWFYPFLIISILSSWIFCFGSFKKILKEHDAHLASVIGTMLYTTNTYILMIVGGGQMGVALSYAFAPLVLHLFFSLLENNKRNFSLLVALLLASSLQLMFDPRIYLVTLSIVFLLYFINVFFERSFLSSTFDMIIVLVFSLILNSFWILPNLFNYNVQYDEAASAFEVVFLSFANFSNTISLLHPNWPENIFGKVYFMRSEFLLLPIIAFASLVFIERSKKIDAKIVIFYACIAIIGSFLAKGTNPPFGEVYQFLSALPGFMMFRDPTKFFLLIIIAFSILIPFSLFRLGSFIEKRTKIRYVLPAIIVLFLLYWSLLLFPALSMSLNGTFKPKVVPQEYISLKYFIQGQKDNFNILWVPQRQRFGFASREHSAINSIDTLGQVKTVKLQKLFQKKETQLQLQKEGVRYVIVPYDSEKEIFLKDHKYNQKEKDAVVSILDSISWLKRVPIGSDFKEIVVYEMQ